MSIQTTSSRTRECAQQVVLLVTGTGLLLLTWLLLYVAIGSLTQSWLNAWGGIPVLQRPPVGIWHRTLGDNYGQWWAVLRPENLALMVGLLLLGFRLVRGRDRAWIPLEFAVLNLLFFIAFMVAEIFAFLLHELWLWVSEPYLPPDVGYRTIWPEVIIEVCLLLVLFVAQARGWLAKWLLRGGAVRGAIIGTPCGALVFASWAALVAHLEHGRVLVGAVSGAAEGAVIGLSVGAIAGASSRLSAGLIRGAIVGALIGWIPAESLSRTLVGAIVGVVVAIVAGAERESQAS